MGTVYVVTGLAFIRDVGELRGRVRIPDFVWKAVYIPGVGGAAYVVRNDDTLAYSVISIDELAHFSGVDAFPTIPKPMRSAAIDLPAPTPHPGEKAARRVAFPWLASGEAIGSISGVEPSAKLVQHSRAILALAVAFAR
jgi:endonuclease G